MKERFIDETKNDTKYFYQIVCTASKSLKKQAKKLDFFVIKSLFSGARSPLKVSIYWAIPDNFDWLVRIEQKFRQAEKQILVQTQYTEVIAE